MLDRDVRVSKDDLLEPVIFLCAMSLLPAWVVPLMWALGALLLVTVGQRFVWAAYAL